MEKLEYDFNCIEVYRRSCSNMEVAVYQAKSRWRRRRRAQVRDIAHSLLDTADPRCRFKFIETEDLKVAFRDWDQFTADMMKSERVERDAFLSVCWLNWAAPALQRAKMQKVQAGMLGGILNQTSQTNLGSVVIPSFVQRRGTLYAKEYLALQMLANNNVNTDIGWPLMYKCSLDERSERPSMTS